MFAQEIKVGTDQVAYFDSIFAQWESDENPGLTLGILQGDQVVHQRGYGLANIESEKIIDGSSQFRVAALSMHYTAYALLLLQEKGALNLEDDVRKYLPNLPQRNEIITLEHLLTHSSGLPG